MTIEELRTLIAPDEHRQLELKKSTGELNVGMHSACAFLNTEGGWLIFGIKPGTLKIVGQQVSDSTQHEISQALSGLEPSVDVRVEYIEIPETPENKVIAMFFEGWVWGKAPYTYHGCPYYRVESTTREMPRQMFEERLRAAKPQFYAWERQQADGIGIEDLDEDRVRGAIRIGVDNGRMPASAMTESIDKVLFKLHLTNNGRPNNAAAMLFGNNTDEYPQFRMRLARFRGNDKNSFLDNQRADGNFFDLLDAGVAFFIKWLPLSGKIEGTKREDRLEIPIVALREALVNALCHRQYDKYNLTIGIAIYDDRVEIENPGVLPPQLTPETIKEPHVSYPYNPIIADVLYKTTFLENWGSGIGRIIDACREQGVPEPRWTAQGGIVTVTFPRRSALSSAVGINGVGDRKSTQESTQKSTQESTQKSTQKSTQESTQESTQKSTQKSTQENTPKSTKKILRLMALNPYITISELCEATGLSEKGVKINIGKLKSSGKLRRVGSNKGGHWEVLE